MKIVDHFWHWQNKLEDRTRRLGRGNYARVLRLARKPSYDEFSKSAWIVGIGIGIVGGLGFVVYYLWLHVPPIISDLFGL